MKKYLKWLFILIVVSCYLLYSKNYNWVTQGFYGDDYRVDFINNDINNEIKKYDFKLVGKFKDIRGWNCELYEKNVFFFYIYVVYAYSEQGEVKNVARGIDEINSGLRWGKRFYCYYLVDLERFDGFMLSQTDYVAIKNGDVPVLDFFP